MSSGMQPSKSRPMWLKSGMHPSRRPGGRGPAVGIGGWAPSELPTSFRLPEREGIVAVTPIGDTDVPGIKANVLPPNSNDVPYPQHGRSGDPGVVNECASAATCVLNGCHPVHDRDVRVVAARGLVGVDNGVAHLAPNRNDTGRELDALTRHRAGLGKKMGIHVRAKRTGRILRLMRGRPLRGCATALGQCTHDVLGHISLRHNARGLLLLGLTVCLLLGSAARFGFRANPGQCPTAPVQTVAIMTQAADGSWITEVRAPRPGEKDFVVCHCQEKRAAAQNGWTVPAFAPIVVTTPPTIDLPLVASGWIQPEELGGDTDPPISQISHPPSA